MNMLTTTNSLTKIQQPRTTCYRDHDYSFNDQGWFNATEAANRFGKRPNDWLNLDETKEYILALCDELSKSDTSQNGITFKSTATIKTNDLIVLNNATSYVHAGYASPVHPHGELALVGYEVNGTQSAPNAVFLCVLSMRSHISMAKLEGDALARAGNHLHLSTNPLQLCHPYLVVNGKASFKVNGAH